MAVASPESAPEFPAHASFSRSWTSSHHWVSMGPLKFVPIYAVHRLSDPMQELPAPPSPGFFTSV
jgi:hypothetical protein